MRSEGRKRRTENAPRTATTRVAIVQPWLPQYRLPFYSMLRDFASARGIEVHVFFGDAPPEWRDRGDTVSAPWATKLPTTTVRLRGRSLMRKDPTAVRQGGFDLLILEQAVRNVETFSLALRPGKAKVAFWGHGKTYTEARSALQERVKQWLTQRGSWFFAYTAGGREAVANAGFEKKRVTVVQNSVDTSSLSAELSSISVEEVDAFRRKHGLTGRVALHLGALDEPKRVPFLIDSACRAHELDPTFRLIVVGSGSDDAIVRDAAKQCGFIHYLGRQFGKEKALALAAADVLLNPGRVGLVAVDSFVSGVPIATTRWDRHAPEFEYLRPGTTALVTDDDPVVFARETVALLRDESQLRAMSLACRGDASTYSIESMAANFLTGIERALGKAS